MKTGKMMTRRGLVGDKETSANRMYNSAKKNFPAKNGGSVSTLKSILQETRVFPPDPAFVKQANVAGMKAYHALSAEAENDLNAFWGRLAREQLIWHKPFTRVLDESNHPFFKWFDDGELNVAYNCLDRHLDTQPDKVAIIFEADDGKTTTVTYRELYARVCRFANGLKSRGIRIGD